MHITYEKFKEINDRLSENAFVPKTKIIGERVKADTQYIDLANGNTHQSIATVVNLILQGKGCLTNPSHLQNWDFSQLMSREEKLELALKKRNAKVQKLKEDDTKAYNLQLEEIEKKKQKEAEEKRKAEEQKQKQKLICQKKYFNKQSNIDTAQVISLAKQFHKKFKEANLFERYVTIMLLDEEITKYSEICNHALTSKDIQRINDSVAIDVVKNAEDEDIPFIFELYNDFAKEHNMYEPNQGCNTMLISASKDGSKWVELSKKTDYLVYGIDEICESCLEDVGLSYGLYIIYDKGTYTFAVNMDIDLPTYKIGDNLTDAINSIEATSVESAIKQVDTFLNKALDEVLQKG